MDLSDFRGHWALVTGASSGIGREFAIQLAAAGLNLVLVARRQEALEELSRRLGDAYGTRSIVVAQDLADHHAANRVHVAFSQEGVRIRLLCNNAGIGHWGRFEDGSSELYQKLVQVNMGAMVALCPEFLEDLASFPSSVVINVSSGAAYQPVPFMAAYAASKAFVQSFSQALHEEWRDRGVLVKTLVPGPTATEFDAKAGAYDSAIHERGDAAKVVESALARLFDESPLLVLARGTYKQRVFSGLFPSRVVVREVAKMFRPPDT